MVGERTYKLRIPERVSIYGMLDGMLVFTPEEVFGRDLLGYGGGPAGALMAMPLDSLHDRPDGSWAGPSHQAAQVFVPTPRQAIADVRVLSDRIVVAINDNVSGRLSIFTPQGEFPWHERSVAVPENLAVGLGDSSKSRGEVFVSTQGFLVPPTLSLADADAATLTPLKSAPAKLDRKSVV